MKRRRSRRMYKPGDRVVFTAAKHSAHPGPRAELVQPEPNGEGYSYNVKKYWLVVGTRPDGRLTVVTRRGKERLVLAADPRLRPARWWETFFFGARFPQQPPANSPSSDSTASPVV
jgi:hypothetical protein